MNRSFSQCLLPAVAAISSAVAFGGCASEEELAVKRKFETRDQRAHREVFYDNWLRPSVTEDEKDFYYRSFWKKKNRAEGAPPPEAPPE